MIKLEQTDTEYFLYVPYEQRERARRMSGRAWDPSLRCWRIPKNDQSTRELIHEFGEEITRLEGPLLNADSGALGTTQGEAGPAATPENPGDDQRDSPTTPDALEQPDLLSLVERLTDREVRLATASAELAALRSQLEASGTLEAELAEANAELAQLRTELAVLKERPTPGDDRATRSGSSLKDALQTVVRELFPADNNTRAISEAVHSNSDLPFTLGRAIETDLRVLMKDVADASLFDIISRADESGILSPRSVDLAHLLRKQRNHVAHGADKGGTNVLATNLMCLAATRLLRNELKPTA